MRYELTNNLTGRKYAWTDADLTREGKTLDEWIASRVKAYGAPVDHTLTQIDDSAQVVQARIDKAWALADSICLAGADHNSRGRYLAWLVDPACPQSRKDAILEVQAWMDLIWESYQAWKANPVTDWAPPADQCPYTFAQIYQTV